MCEVSGSHQQVSEGGGATHGPFGIPLHGVECKVGRSDPVVEIVWHKVSWKVEVNCRSRQGVLVSDESVLLC